MADSAPTLSGFHGRGVIASRPTAGLTGAIYISTDESGSPKWYRANGSTWDDVTPPGGGGGGSGDWVKIATQTASGAVAALTLATIVGTYTHLALSGIVRAVDSATRYLILQFNADTGNNYSYQWVYNNANTTAAGNAGASVAGIFLGELVDGGGTATHGSPVDIIIPNYTNTNWKKALNARIGDLANTGGTAYVASSSTGLWSNTAAITQIDIKASTGNIADKSTITLYGLN